MFMNAAHESAYRSLLSLMGSTSQAYSPVLLALAWLDAKGRTGVRPAVTKGKISFTLLLAESGYWDAADIALLQATAALFFMVAKKVPAMPSDEVLGRLGDDNATVFMAAVKLATPRR